MTIDISPSPNLPAVISPAPALGSYARAARSDATMRAYRIGWADFAEWCAGKQLSALPADALTVVEYLEFLAQGCKLSTIKLRCAAISEAHRKSGHANNNPTRDERVRDTLKGIARVSAYMPTKKSALTVDSLPAIRATMTDKIEDVRDWSILTLALSIAARRTELRNLNVEDVRFLPDRMTITLRHTKTGAAVVNVPRINNELCPVRALRAWLDASDITTGAVYRAIRYLRNTPHISPRAFAEDGKPISEIVKKHAARIGVDPADFAGHSLRSGFMTSSKVDLAERMTVSRHKSYNVASSYIGGDRQMDAIRSAFTR